MADKLWFKTFFIFNGRAVMWPSADGLPFGVDTAGERLAIPHDISIQSAFSKMLEPETIESFCSGRGSDAVRELASSDKWMYRAKFNSAELTFEGLLANLENAPSLTAHEADFLAFLMLLFSKAGVVTCPNHGKSVLPDPVDMSSYVFPAVRALAAGAPEGVIMGKLVRDALESFIAGEGRSLGERNYSELARHLTIEKARRLDFSEKEGEESAFIRDCVERQVGEGDDEAVEYKADSCLDGRGVYSLNFSEAERCYRRLVSIDIDQGQTSRCLWKLSKLYSMPEAKDDAKAMRCLSAAASDDEFAMCDLSRALGGDADLQLPREVCEEPAMRALEEGLAAYSAGDHSGNLAGTAMLLSENRMRDAMSSDEGGEAENEWKWAFAYALLASWALKLRKRDAPCHEDFELEGQLEAVIEKCRSKTGLVTPAKTVAIKAESMGAFLDLALSGSKGRALGMTSLTYHDEKQITYVDWAARDDDGSRPTVIVSCPEGWYCGEALSLTLESEPGKSWVGKEGVEYEKGDIVKVSFDEIRGCDLFLRGVKTGTLSGEFNFKIPKAAAVEALDAGKDAKGGSLEAGGALPDFCGSDILQ